MQTYNFFAKRCKQKRPNIQNMHKNCAQYARNMQNMQEVCKKCAKYAQYAKDMQKICKK